MDYQFKFSIKYTPIKFRTIQHEDNGCPYWAIAFYRDKLSRLYVTNIGKNNAVSQLIWLDLNWRCAVTYWRLKRLLAYPTTNAGEWKSCVNYGWIPIARGFVDPLRNDESWISGILCFLSPLEELLLLPVLLFNVLYVFFICMNSNIRWHE